MSETLPPVEKPFRKPFGASQNPSKTLLLTFATGTARRIALVPTPNTRDCPRGPSLPRRPSAAKSGRPQSRDRGRALARQKRRDARQPSPRADKARCAPRRRPLRSARPQRQSPAPMRQDRHHEPRRPPANYEPKDERKGRGGGGGRGRERTSAVSTCRYSHIYIHLVSFGALRCVRLRIYHPHLRTRGMNGGHQNPREKVSRSNRTGRMTAVNWHLGKDL